MDQNGHVIVVDNKACTVFIFQLSGKLLTKFGSRGNGDKQFAGSWWEGPEGEGTASSAPLCSVSALPQVLTSQQSTRTTRSS